MITYTDLNKIAKVTVETQLKTLNPKLFKPSSRYYLNDYEEEQTADGKTRKIHYLSGGNGLSAIHVEEDGNGQLYYAYTDYLGSLTALTDAGGNVKERQAFDPWGNRRNPNDWTSLITTPVSNITGRGYTMHSLSRVYSGNIWMGLRLSICSVRTLVLPQSKTISRTNPDSDEGTYRGMAGSTTRKSPAS